MTEPAQSGGVPSPSGEASSLPKAGDVSKENEVRAKMAEEAHLSMRDFIRQADQKAAFFFAGATALIAFLYNSKLINITRWLKPLVRWTLLDGVALVAVVLLLACSLWCVWTILPRLRGSKRGLIYFGAISEFESSQEFAREALARSVLDLVADKLQHVHQLAVICKRKYASLVYGTRAGFFGVAATIVLLVLSS